MQIIISIALKINALKPLFYNNSLLEISLFCDEHYNMHIAHK